MSSSAQKFGSNNVCRWIITCSFNGADNWPNPPELGIATVVPELAV